MPAMASVVTQLNRGAHGVLDNMTNLPVEKAQAA